MTGEERHARRLIVTGRVQGVWYRGWTVDQARALHLDGWVRNRTDGTVEILAAGSEDAINMLATLCKRGPPHAQVETVESLPADDPRTVGFRQRPTA